MNTLRKIGLAGRWSALPALETALGGQVDGVTPELSEVNGETPEQLVRPGAYDAIVVHLGMTSFQGAHLLRALFASSIRPPIFAIIDANSFETWSRFADAVDDYCVLGVNGEAEMAQRIRKLVHARRASPADLRKATQALRFGDVWLAESTRYLIGAGGGLVRLSFAQARLLSVLCGAAGEYVGAETLAAKLGYDNWTPADRSIEVLVRRLRQKVTSLTRQPLVENVGRLEYRLAAIPQRCLLPAEYVQQALQQASSIGLSRLRVEAAVMSSTAANRAFPTAPWVGMAA